MQEKLWSSQYSNPGGKASFNRNSLRGFAARPAILSLPDNTASYKKAKNISKNPNVSFVVPFPHLLLSFIPPSSAQFQGRAEILPFDDQDSIRAFQTKRVLRITYEHARRGHESEERVFIRIVPDGKSTASVSELAYGVGP